MALVYWLSADILSEDIILKWYKDAHVAKGKSIFLVQMKSFVEWLKQAEEEGKSRYTKRRAQLLFLLTGVTARSFIMPPPPPQRGGGGKGIMRVSQFLYNF